MPITHLVLGGARSGKSRWAEELSQQVAAQNDSDKPVIYLATATAGDHEMATRIEHHRQRRDDRWQTLEEPLYLAHVYRALPEGSTVLIDCLTLWLSNCLQEDCWST